MASVATVAPVAPVRRVARAAQGAWAAQGGAVVVVIWAAQSSVQKAPLVMWRRPMALPPLAALELPVGSVATALWVVTAVQAAKAELAAKVPPVRPAAQVVSAS